MTEVRYSLCPNCDACPEVVITDDSVLIGEEGNQVRLSPEQWDVLVAGIKEGRLGQLATEDSAKAEECGCGCGCEV